MTDPHHLAIATVEALDRLGDVARAPAILLSASQPVLRYDEHDPRHLTNRRHVETARPELIRAAVVELCKWTFQRRYALVFGGHPAITPVVLEAARRFGEPSALPRVFVFQSEFFPADARPRATHDLVTWDVGRLMLTPAIEGDRDASLGHMRDIMVRWPGVRAAVFIGGMEGIEDEAQRFKDVENPGRVRRPVSPRPCFALGSAGGAALDVMETWGNGIAGLGRHVPQDAMYRLLRESESYPLVMQQVFRELGDEPRGDRADR